MIRSHEAVVENQFGPNADAYVNSAVHASGEDLDVLEQIVRQASPARALDIGSGGGHAAYRLARHTKAVIATDLSADMLTAVKTTSRDKGLSNVETRVAQAEALPFGAGEFDFLACRFSAHHWRGFEAGLREARRVLTAGSTAVFIDAVATGSAPMDTHLQAVELLRDTSHVRNYRAAEWLNALSRSRFLVRTTRTWRLRMDFPTWIGRMRAPNTNEQAIRGLQQAASAEVIEHFAVEVDGSFLLDTLLIEAVAG